MADIYDEVIASVRGLVRRDGARALHVDDLRQDDLAALTWSGTASHLKSVAAALARVPAGDIDYLAVRAPSRHPIAKGAVDHAEPRRPGRLWQLATHPALQSLGIGTHLIGALEHRARSRGLSACWLGVELGNPRARALYERLGYVAFDEVDDGWDTEDETGRLVRYETRVTLMQREL